MTKELKPIEFDTHNLPEAPIEIFPAFTRAYIEAAAEETQTTLDANCMAALSILSTAGANKFYVQSDWLEPINTYSVVVAGSGERKSTTFRKYAFPILELEQELTEKNKRWVTGDVTMERLVGLMKENKESIAILSAEGGVLETAAGRYGNTPNVDVLLQGFSREAMRIDRMNKEPIRLNEPCLTIGLFIQPTLLQNASKRFIERGLLGRFLYSFPRSLRGKRRISPEKVDEKMTAEYGALIRNVIGFEPKEAIVLQLDEQASGAFADFSDKFERRLGNGGDLADDVISSWTDRFPGQLLRIASLVHIAKQAETGELKEETFNRYISKEVIESVISRQDYFIEHAKMAFGIAKSDEVLENAKYLLDFFQKEGKVCYKRNQDIWAKTTRKFQKSENLDRALSVLEDREYIRVQVDDKQTRGRKGQVVYVHEGLIKEQNRKKGPIQEVENSAKRAIDSLYLEVKPAQ